MKTAIRTFRDALLLHVAIIGLSLVFKLARLLDARFRKAVASYCAVYQFRSENSARQIVFKQGRIASRRGECQAPDFVITFIDLPGALSYMAKYSNDPITLLMENKIDQIGNLYFLYKFGYLCGLCEDYFSNIFKRKNTVREPLP
jgi:hypothetical protein